MSPLIEEARRRQRRRRAGLSVVVLILAGVGAAGFGTRHHHGSPARSTGVGDSLETVASGVVIRSRSSDGRLGGPSVITNVRATEGLKRGRRVTMELRLGPKTGTFEVRLPSSH